jgi:glucan phosphoethanolaminetransferase (alkaline phosphatase superfamily)
VRARLPSVLFIITESVRASDYCPTAGGRCAVAPEVAALVPSRISFGEMRSVSSYTAVSIAAILSGAVPSVRRDTALPLLFDFSKALRHPSESLSVAYWSAQTASTLDRPDLRKTLDSFVTVEDLVGHTVGDEDEVFGEGVDRLLASRIDAEIRKIAAPFVAVAHFQGTHAPYFVDDADAPFRPFSHVVAWSGLEELHNAYRDAIHEQDKSVAAVIRAFLARVGTSPYVILFTSDHGEAFGEHGAIHHGQNLYEEQVHVPAWIATGNGALDERELAAIRSYEHAVTTHLDLLPTLLDIEGILGGEASARAGSGR